MSRFTVAFGALSSFLLLALVPEMAGARVFDFRTQSMAAFFRGTYAPSNVDDAAYGLSSGVGTKFNQQVVADYGGEVGFLLMRGPATLVLSVETLIPQHLTDAKGSDSSGTELFALDSKVLGFVPSAGVELAVFQAPTFKVFIGGGVGWAVVSVTNQYAFTSDGTSQLSISDYTEDISGRGLAGRGYLGGEILFTDNVTASLDIGYRYLRVDQFRHQAAATTLVGNVAKNDVVKNHDGTDRRLDLSAPFIGLSFRFYINM